MQAVGSVERARWFTVSAKRKRRAKQRQATIQRVISDHKKGRKTLTCEFHITRRRRYVSIARCEDEESPGAALCSYLMLCLGGIDARRTTAARSGRRIESALQLSSFFVPVRVCGAHFFATQWVLSWWSVVAAQGAPR
jgi:hypothetical protein